MQEETNETLERRGAPSSRERVLHLLAEAAELEHNILCSYLYAVFSLKRRTDEDVSDQELEAIGRWRDEMMGLCVEEMVHLAQVANLFVAVGSRPHFNRPNLPAPPGYHPAAVTIALGPFGLETLEHFIFLERPEEVPARDPAAFREEQGAERPQPSFPALMPRAPDYATIGEFYAALRAELQAASDAVGERALFNGPADHQITGAEIRSPDLVVVRGAGDAARAIDFIVEQGEGSGGVREGSHFGRFEAIRDELVAMRARRPDFEPARKVASNPTMHAPTEQGRVWVDSAQAAPVIDAANATYGAMLRCLAHVYDTPASAGDRRAAALSAALACMKAVTALGTFLTELPARDAEDSPRAGMSFAMPRAVEGHFPEMSLPALAERVVEIAARVADMTLGGEARSLADAALAEASEALRRAV